MPGFDGTGPQGWGPMTGGARGYCNTAGAGYGFGRGRGFRRGSGPGYGRGMGFRRGFGRWGVYPPAGSGRPGPVYSSPYGNPYTMKPEDEISMLRDEAGAIKDELDAINKRIEELESQSPES